MPPRGKFKEGGFVTFIKSIMDTVELYHEKDINPRLALTVLKKMAIDYDEPLNVVAVGMRDERVFIQVKVSESIIQDQFKQDYYSRYENDLKLWSSNSYKLPPIVDDLIEKKLTEIASDKNEGFVFVDVTNVEGNYTQINKGVVTMTGDRNIHMGSGNYNEKIEGDYIQGNYFAAGERQTLAQAAAEIQQLLEQLDKTYSADTTASKMELATEAIKCIDSNPDLTARIISALQAGSVKAFEQFLSHPAASFMIAALEDWQKTKGS